VTGRPPGPPEPHERQERPRRPLPTAALPEAVAAVVADPATAAEERLSAAEAVAQALVSAAREGAVSVDRLVALADEVGVAELDAVWRDAEPGSLAGALRVLYLLRTWARLRPRELTRLAVAGQPHAEVAASVAGLPAYPAPEDLVHLVEDLLRGALERDLATALHRAAALCRLVAAGRGAEDPHDGRPGGAPWADSVLGARLLSTAAGLDAAAAAADAG
jgi:hypothetical protein